jgi:hypothetical protein
MTLVVVERSFEEPADVSGLVEQEERASWCFDEQDVKFLYSYVARTRKHMACIYEAPDAEAVRTTQRTAKAPYDRIWAAVRVDAEPIDELPEGYTRVVVQRELPFVATVEMVRELSKGGRDCIERRKGAPVESLLSRDGRRMVCSYVAPDTESVREANKEADLPVLRAWPATILDPGE